MYKCTYVRTRSTASREGEIPLSLMDASTVVAGGKRTDTQTDGETVRDLPLRNSPSLSVGIYPSLSPFLFLSPFVPLRVNSLIYVCAVRGVTYPPGKAHSPNDSRHFVVPLAPDDTRKPNGKRKYDTDFRSVETNTGNSRQIAQDRAHTPGFRWSLPRDSTPGFAPPRIPPSPARSHIRMLETRRLVAITAESRLVGPTCFSSFCEKPSRSR